VYVERGEDNKYRLTTSFKLEVGIIGFDTRSETSPNLVTVRKDTKESNSWQRFQKSNRLFESISLRYLFRENEDHEVKPQPYHDEEQDQFAEARVENSESREVGFNAGISGVPPAVSPSLEFHVQKNKTVTIEQTMKSWRRGLSVEKCMHNLL
jgi:hypothetical protein